MGKTCAINVTDKGLICRICKELLQKKRKGRDNLKAKKKKRGKCKNRHSTTEDIQTNNKHRIGAQCHQ